MALRDLVKARFPDKDKDADLISLHPRNLNPWRVYGGFQRGALV